MSDLRLPDCGHGWVHPAPVKARCGGPGMCAKCADDQLAVDLSGCRFTLDRCQSILIEGDEAAVGRIFKRLIQLGGVQWAGLNGQAAAGRA